MPTLPLALRNVAFWAVAVVAGVIFLFQPLLAGSTSLPVPTVEVLEAERGPGYAPSTTVAPGHRFTGHRPTSSGLHLAH
jgi:hypothetical protein